MTISIKADGTGSYGVIQVNGVDSLTIGNLGGILEPLRLSDASTTAQNQAGTSTTTVVTPLGIREAFNATGTAPVYACRAWVNFNGIGTVSIRASANVSSITDNAVGDYTVNFINPMPDALYTVLTSTGSPTASDASRNLVTKGDSTGPTGKLANSVRLVSGDTGTDNLLDIATADVAIFR